MAGQGRRQRDVGGGAERWRERGGSVGEGWKREEVEASSLQRAVHLPPSLPHPPGVGG